MKFVLLLELAPVDDEVFGCWNIHEFWWLSKIFDMPELPNVGDSVEIGGNIVKVQEVRYQLKQGVVEVFCDCRLIWACCAFLEDPIGWEFIEIDRRDKKQFRKQINRMITGRKVRLGNRVQSRNKST